VIWRIVASHDGAAAVISGPRQLRHDEFQACDDDDERNGRRVGPVAHLDYLLSRVQYVGGWPDEAGRRVMGIFKRIAAVLSPPPAHEIIATIDPWTLASAVGAENGSIGIAIGFDSWLHLSRKNWMPQLQKTISASDAAIERALRQFVRENRARNYLSVLRAEQAKRASAAKLGTVIRPSPASAR
jgi:hypothetical protein